MAEDVNSSKDLVGDEGSEIRGRPPTCAAGSGDEKGVGAGVTSKPGGTGMLGSPSSSRSIAKRRALGVCKAPAIASE